MKFVIATVAFWEYVGFCTDGWRKNKDGTLAMAHLERAETLVPDITSRNDVVIYDHPSEEFNLLRESEEWKYEGIS